MHKKREMGTLEKPRERHHYASDFKEEIIRMLHSGKNVQELSKRFGIGTNILYTWKKKSIMKNKNKTIEDQSDFSLKIISENEKLKKENLRLREERDILKKALSLFSKSI